MLKYKVGVLSVIYAGLVLIAVPFIYSNPDYLAVQCFFEILCLVPLFVGLKIAFFPSEKIKKTRRTIQYYLGISLIALSLFLSLITLLVWTEDLGATTILAFILPPGVLVWLWMQRSRVQQESNSHAPSNFTSTKISTSKQENSSNDVIDNNQKKELISIKGKGKQASDSISLEQGRYKLNYDLQVTQSMDSLSITMLDTKEVSVKELIILDEERSSKGSVVFTVETDSRYVFNITPWSLESKQLKWEISINKL